MFLLNPCRDFWLHHFPVHWHLCHGHSRATASSQLKSLLSLPGSFWAQNEQQPDSGQEGRVLRPWTDAGKVFPDHLTSHGSAPATPSHLSDLWTPFSDLLVKSSWRDIVNVHHWKPNCPEIHPKGNRAAQAPIPYSPYSEASRSEDFVLFVL